jgi:hypothetical protein
MKKLPAFLLMLLLAGFCAASNGDVLSYNLYGVVKAVDIDSENIDRTAINGVFIADVDENLGEIATSTLILYGRDETGTRVYRRFDDVAYLTLAGNAEAFVIDAGQGSVIILTGNTRERFRRRLNGINAANTLDGSIQVEWGSLLDLDQLLVGSGFISANLDVERTRNAAQHSLAVTDVAEAIIQRLVQRGYVAVMAEEPAPV